MRRPGRPTGVLLIVLGSLGGVGTFAGGCGGTRYLYGSLGEVVAQPKPKGCEFALVSGIPEPAHDALGVLAPVDIQSTKLTEDEGRFKSAVAAEVCAVGGDGVLVERNAQGQIVRGTVIKLR